MADRIVEIISKDKRYRQQPYPSKPAFDTQLRVYLTGQQMVPGDPSRSDFLTEEEMTNVSKISTAKQKKFPVSCVINPTEVTLIQHRRKLNITPNDPAKSESKYPGDFKFPNDKALYEYLLEREFIALSEEEYIPNVHYFYILDKEIVADRKLSKREKRWNAERFLREDVAQSKYREMCLLLNHRIKGVNINYDLLTDVQLKDALLDAAEKYPDEVLSCDYTVDPMVQKELFVLLLIDKHILTLRNGAYYDGAKFLGSTVNAIIATLEKDETLMAKFSGLLNT